MLKTRLLRALLFTGLAVLLVSVAMTLPLRWINPPTTAFVWQDDSVDNARLRRHWVPLAEISPAMPVAVVASEDQKFPEHFGFDFASILQALQEEGRLRGASTISQQLAKNLYLWPGRSLLRKGIEAWFTLLIELTWPKERILEVYLNVVEFGPGLYGVGTASETFYHKPASALTEGEAALLAAVLPNPKRLSADRPSSYVYQRARTIQHAMGYLGGPTYLAGIL